jgi:hypothetical protein
MAGKNWFKTLTGIIISSSALLGAVIFIVSHFMGWITIFEAGAVEDFKRAELDSVSDQMSRQYIKHLENGGKLPFVLEERFNKIQSEIDSSFQLQDSANFILQQTTNIIFSRAFAPVQKVLDSHNCVFWFHVDPSGGYWWRDRITAHDNQRIKTFQYRVTYNKTIGSFEYTDIHGHVLAFPHKWEKPSSP